MRKDKEEEGTPPTTAGKMAEAVFIDARATHVCVCMYAGVRPLPPSLGFSVHRPSPGNGEGRGETMGKNRGEEGRIRRKRGARGRGEGGRVG